MNDQTGETRQESLQRHSQSVSQSVSLAALLSNWLINNSNWSEWTNYKLALIIEIKHERQHRTADTELQHRSVQSAGDISVLGPAGQKLQNTRTFFL